MTPPISALGEMLEQTDYWRGSAFDLARGLPFKEWSHFVVFSEHWTLVFNLNLDGDGTGRSIVVFSHEAWHGHVARCREPELRPGALDATFGKAGVRWREGHYELWAHGGPIDLEIDLRPLAVPSLSHHIRLGRGAQLSWCLVPRLCARGWVDVGARGRVAVEACPAYHDHNWGRFQWGGNFAWDWGCAMSADLRDPWTVIFAQMHDRCRHRTSATSVFVLKDGRHIRYFRDLDVLFSSTGTAHRRPAGRVPAPAALLVPDEDGDVPEVIRFQARRDADQLSGEVRVTTRGQILVPSEVDVSRVTRLNEAPARVRVEGRCADEAILVNGVGLLEAVHG